MKSDTFKAKPLKSNKIYLNCEAQNEVWKLSEEIGTLCRRHFGSSMERLIGFGNFPFHNVSPCLNASLCQPTNMTYKGRKA